MRDGVRLFTAVYVPKDQRQPYPILLTRTPYSVQPYGVEPYKPDLGPSPSSARRATSSPTRMSRALDVRGRVRQHAAAPRPQKRSPNDIDESTDTYDTIDWLIKHVPEPQRPGRACGASPIPASTRPPG